MKTSSSIRLDDSVLRYAKGKGNMSRYIEGLIKQDMATEMQKPIIKAVREALLADEAFFTELTNRVVEKSRSY